ATEDLQLNLRMPALQLVTIDANALAALQPAGVALAEQQRDHDDGHEHDGCYDQAHTESLFALFAGFAYSLIRWSLIRCRCSPFCSLLAVRCSWLATVARVAFPCRIAGHSPLLILAVRLPFDRSPCIVC